MIQSLIDLDITCLVGVVLHFDYPKVTMITIIGTIIITSTTITSITITLAPPPAPTYNPHQLNSSCYHHHHRYQSQPLLFFDRELFYGQPPRPPPLAPPSPSPLLLLSSFGKCIQWLNTHEN
jgi:hypothetical protein